MKEILRLISTTNNNPEGASKDSEKNGRRQGENERITSVGTTTELEESFELVEREEMGEEIHEKYHALALELSQGTISHV